MPVVLLTPAEVSARLGIAISTLSKLRMIDGGPPFVKLGAAVRYPDDDLDAWIAKQPRLTSTADVVPASLYPLNIMSRKRA